MTGPGHGGGLSAVSVSPLDPVVLREAAVGCLVPGGVGLVVVVGMTVVELRRRAAVGEDLGFPVPWVVAALPLFLVAAGVAFLVAARSAR